MIRQILLGIAAAAGGALLYGSNTETIQYACTFLRETPNSACGLEQIMHGLGAAGLAGGLTGLGGSLLGGGVGAATERPVVGGAIEVLTDIIAGYFVVRSQWWINNVTDML